MIVCVKLVCDLEIDIVGLLSIFAVVQVIELTLGIVSSPTCLVMLVLVKVVPEI